MHTQALHILSNTFSCCKNSAHRSISSEMNSTYGMWTNPKTVRACQQKCTMIGGLLVGCWWVVGWRTRAQVLDVSLRMNSKCVPYSFRTRANYSRQIPLTHDIWCECALAHPTHKQPGDTLTHAQNEFPLSSSARSTIFEKLNTKLKCRIACKCRIGADIIFIVCVVRALNFPIE